MHQRQKLLHKSWVMRLLLTGQKSRLNRGDLLLVAVLTRRVAGDQEVNPDDLRLFIVEIK